LASGPANIMNDKQPLFLRLVARLFLLALLFAPGVISAQASAMLRVPAYTQLVLRMSQRMNSDEAHQGQTFRFKVAEDIVVDGKVAIPAGSYGEGEVIHARESGGRDHPGELVLAARYVEVDGRRIKLRSFVAGATDRANDALAVPLFDKATGGGRGDPVNLGRDGLATARTAEDVLLAPQDEDEAEPRPTRTDTPPPEGIAEFAGDTGTVVLFREPGKLNNTKPPAPIHDGDKILESLGVGRYLVVSAPTGIHEFRTRDSKEPDIRLEIGGGETYYVACAQPRSGTRMNCAPSNRTLFDYTKPDLRPAN
jgi:hypothetical protein